MVGGDPLVGGEEAAGDTKPDHKRIKAFQLFLRALFTAVGVVLLVHTVEFDEGLVVVAHGAADLSFEAFGEGAAEGVAVLLYAFDGGYIPGFTHINIRL